MAIVSHTEQGSIALAAGSSTGTFTPAASYSYNTSNTILIYEGVTTDSANNNTMGRCAVRIAVTNGTTITATREQNTTAAVTVYFTILEFGSGVNSVQAGTIAMTSASSATATITAVGSTAFVLFLGGSTAQTGLLWSDIVMGVDLTNSTTVTGHCLSSATTKTVGYMVVDLDSTIVLSAAPYSFTSALASATDTQTVTSVTTNNSVVFHNGTICGTGGIDVQTPQYHNQLSSSTLVTATRSSSAATASRTHYITVVEFASAALDGAVQRGTIALSSATSNTATISSIDTSRSFVNFGGWLSATQSASRSSLVNCVLTNGTTVTAACNASGSPTISYEVVQFAAAAASGQPTSKRLGGVKFASAGGNNQW